MRSKQQMLSALDGLIQEAERLYKQFLADYQPWSADFAAWLKASESTVEAIFGSTSHALLAFKSIHYIPPPGEQYAHDVEQAKGRLTWFESGLRYAHVTLIGYRYSVERLATEPPARPTPNVFISHGGPSRIHVDQARDFLSALGLQPIIVADLPNMNLSVNEKVRFYMNLCTGAIALATSEDETIANAQRTRPNVENEIGMLQTAPNVGNRIIYLKEPNVKFASNYSEKVWIPFTKDRIQDAFIPIARELRAFGFLGPT